MICLGIESTAHTFSVGIVDDNCKVLSVVSDMYIPEKGWGIHPNEAKEHHIKLKDEILEKALAEAKIEIKDIDIFAYSKGPGLPPCLKIGSEFVKEIAGDKPVVGVNHCIGHIEIGKQLTDAKDPVTLYVSGGNTQIIAFTEGKYRIFGETMDKPIGSAIDMFIRKTDGGSPGGPIMQKLAKGGKYIELPYVVKGMDLSFSGIVSDVLRRYEQGAKLGDLCYSFQETCYAMLTEVTERAMAHTGKKEVLLTGGVAASTRLQEMIKTMAEERGAKFYLCPRELAGDNGANIGWLGILQYKYGNKGEDNPDFNSRWRTDQVDVTWIKNDVDKYVKELENGNVIVFPSETSYGLGADATNEKAVEKVFELKERDKGKPLSILVDSIRMAEKYCEVNDKVRDLVKRANAPVTIIVRKKNLPDNLCGDTVAFRVVQQKELAEVIRKFGKPITGTSANISGGDNLYKIDDVCKLFSDKDVFILDGGDLVERETSTIYDSVNDKVIRQGEFHIP